MTSAQEQRAEEIFSAALERPAENREAFVRDACGAQTPLEASVRDLLAAHGRAENILERPVTDHFPELAAGRAPPAWIGRRIGPFVLQRVIAAGGMGTVYEAVQDHPHRNVALKVMTTGLFSETALRRFQYEAEILGRLRHPGIAHVYEAGVHEEGSLALSYIAMELIEGATTIGDFARDRKLLRDERLALFVRVCEAVHYANVKGVIHRDLKPGNVLLDADGNPKVIDFGVARAADARLAQATTLTLAGQLVGTLPYMSPEQCGDDPTDVDVRSDVYSLGVMLFELLTGELPHPIDGLSVTSAVARIRDGRPRLPSRVDPTLRGDLETILLKALEPDRERRYGSARELGVDLGRFLRQEPIGARPPSALYQVRMFSRRHRRLVAGLGVIFFMLVAATGVSLRFALRAETARRDEVVQRSYAEEINSFLHGVLAAARPSVNLEGDLTVSQLLREASERLEVDADLHPRVEAGIRETIGVSFGHLGETQQADRHLRRALELWRDQLAADDPDIGRLLAHAAENHVHAGQLDRAQRAAEAAIAILEGSGSQHAAARMIAYSALARVHRDRNEFAESERLFRQALLSAGELRGQERVLEAGVHNNLGALFVATGDLAQAKAELGRAAAIAGDLPTRERFNLASQQANLGSVLFGRGDVQGADRLWREALEVFRRALPADHPRIATLLSNLAMAVSAEDLEQAIDLQRQALAIRRERYPGDHLDVARSLEKLAWTLTDAGAFDEAEAQLGEALAMKQRLFGTRRCPEVAITLRNAGFLQSKRGQHEAAERSLEEALEILRATLPPNNAHVPATLSLLALARLEADDAEGAEAIARQAWELRQEQLGEDSWLTANSKSLYGECLASLGRYDDAEPLLVEALHVIARARGPRDQRTGEALQRVERLYHAWGRPEKAAAERARLRAHKD